MFYNAIVREFLTPEGKVTGRVLLKDLKQVPTFWKIQYGGDFMERFTSLDTLMCGSEEPIQLFRPFPPVPNGVTIQIVDELKTKDVPVSLDYTVETVRVNAFYLLGTPKARKRVRLNGSPVDDRMTLKELGVKAGDVLTLRRYISILDQDLPTFYSGPSTLRTVDLDGDQREGRSRGTYAQNWAGYDIGLNLYGVCPNPSCISKVGGNGGDAASPKEVVVKAQYGFVRMARNQNKFPCPACRLAKRKGVGGRDKVIGMFTPKNFLVCYGRALFQFKKIGVTQPVKRVLLESGGLRDQFADFAEGDTTAAYDFIEITTVGKDSSPHHCVVCDRSCSEHTRSKGSEILLLCGHAYHMRCLPDPGTRGECGVCRAEFYDGILEFLESVGGGEYDKLPKKFNGGFHWDMYGAEGVEHAQLVIDWDEYHDNLERLEEEEEKREERKTKKKRKMNKK